jgi:hypothetical protein
MRRITISLSSKNQDAVTVLRALDKAPYWKRSAELLRWAAAYLNGEVAITESESTDLDIEEIDALLDDF